MAFQSVPGVVECVARFSRDGHPAVMTFYGSFGGNYILGNVEALADAMDAWMVAEYKPLMSNTTLYVSMEARGLENENDYQASNNDGTGVGGVAQNALPMNVTWAVKRTSGLTGRSARGRVYCVGIPINALAADENYFASAQVDPFVAALNEVRVAMATVDFEEVIVSRYTGGAPRGVGVIFGVNEYVAVDYRVDSQRGRLE